MANYCKCSCGAALVVRIFHTLLVLGIAASLLYKNSWLHQCLVKAQNIPLGIAYLCVVVWALAMYHITCLTDPGYVKPPHKKKKKIKPTINRDDDECGDEDDDDDETVSRLPDSYCGNDEGGDASKQMLPSKSNSCASYRVCDYCEINQPMRTKHCEDCNRCVRKFDHHCPWLEACIGERNHRYFLWFLFSTFMLSSITIYITWETIEYRLEWGEWLKLNAILFIDMAVLVMGGLVTAGLFGFHTYLMVKGMTTWEAASRERIPYLKFLDEDFNPFDEGLCKNLYHFMFSRRQRKWEKVYAHKARETNGIV